MDHDLMYVVINGEAIMLENGAPVSYLVDDNDGTIDWTAGDTLDWDDMLPEEYKMYKSAVDFLQTYANNIYVKWTSLLTTYQHLSNSNLSLRQLFVQYLMVWITTNTGVTFPNSPMNSPKDYN